MNHVLPITVFFQLYPNLAARQDLPWTQYKKLITIEDAGERKMLEVQIVQKKLTTRNVQKISQYQTRPRCT